ncbi:MAG: N-acetyltransferase [Pseudomonadota bacterium]
MSKVDEFGGEDATFDITPLTEDQQMLTLFENSKIYVYEEDSILGFVGNKGNYISWLFVHPQHRNRGIGNRLIGSLLTNLAGTVALNVAKSNKVATNLYSKLGFTVAKEFEGKYQGVPIIVNRMEYEI